MAKCVAAADPPTPVHEPIDVFVIGSDIEGAEWHRSIC